MALFIRTITAVCTNHRSRNTMP